jgi:translation initiation factor 1 (eIF-1/SUI1)
MGQRIIIPIKNIKLYRRVKIGNVTFVESTKNVKEERLASYLKDVMSAMTTINLNGSEIQSNCLRTVLLRYSGVPMMTKQLRKMLERILNVR